MRSLIKLFLTYSIINAEKSPFLDKYIHRNEWYEEVFRPNESLDAHTITILSVISLALVSYFRVAAKEHLPGGEFHGLSSDDVRGVLTHNKFCERMFGYWRQLMRYMPNVQALTAESFTLFALNRTAAWIATKEEAERHAIVNRARSDVKTLRLKYKERKAEIRRVRRENLENERQEKERKERDRAADIQRLVKRIEEIGGLWGSASAVDEGLKKLETGARNDGKVQIEAIKTQINFRKKGR